MCQSCNLVLGRAGHSSHTDTSSHAGPSGSIQGTNHCIAHPQMTTSDSKTPPAQSNSSWGAEIPSGAAVGESRSRAAQYSLGQRWATLRYLW